VSAAGAAPRELVRYARDAEPRLRAFLDRKRGELLGLPVDLLPAHDAVTAYVLRGGKRLRGALVVLGAESAGADPAVALDASIGIELLHAYLLIHDDFMDRDELRRGGPTLHVSLGERSPHLGDSLAVLLGSLCEAWTLELVLASPVAPASALAAGRLVATALQQVIVGQMLDLSAPFGPELDDAGVAQVQRLKTGSYTFELPLRVGALLGGASADLLEALSAFARPLGVAFQIADDLLGTLGASEVTGKPNLGDLREGKRTLLVARAFRMASPADAARLRAGLGRRNLSEEEGAELREVLVRSGAADSCRAEAEVLRTHAVSALENAPLPARVAESLREIADYTVRRAL
jgi:geranylgeranyl diphosphate synthase, type I